MKIRALAVAAALWGCSSQVSTYSASSGSLAISRDDALLYAVDADSDALFVLDAKTEEVKAKVAVGRQPERVVVGPDDTIYVSNRMGRSISVIHRGDWSEAARLDTAVEPTGMAVDGNTLLVVNATMLTDSSVGSLMAFDTRSLQAKYEIPVGNEPRGIAVSGGKAFVSLFKDGDVVTVDLASHQVINARTNTYERLNSSALSNGATTTQFPTDVGGAPPPDSARKPGAFFGITKFHPRGMGTLALSPEGTQVYASALLASDAVLPATAAEATDATGIAPREPSGGGGDGYGGGSCGSGSVATPAILTFDGTGNSLAEDVGGCGGQHLEGQPAQVLTSGNPSLPIQGPTAAAVDPTGAFLFVVAMESNNVAILPTNSGAPRSNGSAFAAADGAAPREAIGGLGFSSGSAHTTVMVGAGPSGIALSQDGKTAWVHNAFDHSISRLQMKDGVVQETHVTAFTTDTLAPEVAAGRKLFFSASDSRMSGQGTGIACASCHLEGREDGHVWNFTDGPRQTPSLAGRMLSKTAPFHWNGEFEGLASFMATTVNHRMGGSGVSAAMERQIAAFIDAQPTPDNPYKLDTLSEAQQRGHGVFVKAQCNSCHRGEALTDNSFVDVGTYVTQGNVVDDFARVSKGGINTPSLLGLSRSAPYLHDGSAMTLKERIVEGKSGDLHGKTSALTDAEVDDLVEYLKSL